METTDYVDYQTAVALKECGFDEPCEMFYPDNIKIPCSEISPFPKPRNWNVVEGKTSAVPLWHAQKWMREKKDLLVSVIPVCYYYEDREWVKEEPIKWCFTVNNLHSIAVDHQGRYATYEQAISAGIAAALELITKGE